MNPLNESRKYRMWMRQHGLCPLCGQKIPERDIDDIDVCNIDHVISKAHGGSNVDGNLQLAHVKCNHQKGCGCKGLVCYAQQPDLYVKPDNHQYISLWRSQNHHCGRCGVIIFPSHVLDRSQVDVQGSVLAHVRCMA